MDKFIGWYRRVRRGTIEAPRGLTAHVTRNQVYYYTPLSLIRRSGGNPAIGIMEGLQLIAGVFDKDAIVRIAPHAKHELFTEQMAYGPRVVKQLPQAVSELIKDPASRRAVLVIASADDTLEDRPCTLSIQFHAQPSATHTNTWYISTTAFMRSSDAIWGLPYDVTQFGMLAWVVGSVFAVQRSCSVLMGESSIMIGNAHIYTDTDPARNGRPWFKTVGPLTMPGYKSLPLWRDWAARSIKQAKVAGDLYRQFEVIEQML